MALGVAGMGGDGVVVVIEVKWREREADVAARVVDRHASYWQLEPARATGLAELSCVYRL
jgi:hypothetical protein